MSEYLTFQWISLYVFIGILVALVLKHKDKMELQKMFFPVLYVGIFRTGFGIKLMKHLGTKYRTAVRMFGWCGIGMGVIGMAIICFSLIFSTIQNFLNPALPAGVQPVLPNMTVPGFGFIPFWYWIIALFVIVLIHEFAHGIVAKAHGVKIKSSGVGFMAFFLPIVPLAFVEPDEKALAKEPDHVKHSIYAAGVFSNLVSALAIFLIWMFILVPVTANITNTDGVVFTKLSDEYPAWELPDDLVIREVNGVATLDGESLLGELNKLEIGDEVTLSDGVDSHTITTAESPEGGRAFLGITSITTHMVKKDSVNQGFFAIFGWFAGLLVMIGKFSLAIGLANLLPIGPFDGGQMLRTYLLSSFDGNKEKAMKWLLYSSAFFGFLLIFGLGFWVKSLF